MVSLGENPNENNSQMRMIPIWPKNFLNENDSHLRMIPIWKFFGRPKVGTILALAISVPIFLSNFCANPQYNTKLNECIYLLMYIELCGSIWYGWEIGCKKSAPRRKVIHRLSTELSTYKYFLCAYKNISLDCG